MSEAVLLGAEQSKWALRSRTMHAGSVVGTTWALVQRPVGPHWGPRTQVPLHLARPANNTPSTQPQRRALLPAGSDRSPKLACCVFRHISLTDLSSAANTTCCLQNVLLIMMNSVSSSVCSSDAVDKYHTVP